METLEKSTKSEVVNKPRNRVVTLVVKASELYALASTEENVDDKSYLHNDDGYEGRFGDKNNSFETTAYKDHYVTWRIESFNPKDDRGYDLQLYFVQHNDTPDNPNFFSDEFLFPNTAKMNSIPGKIIRGTNVSIDDEYSLCFRITHNNLPKYYTVDPRIRINP